MKTTNYNYQVQYSSKFKRDLKKLIKQGKDIEKLLDVVDQLANKKELDLRYKNHFLMRDRHYKNCKECHIEPDWLLIYQYHDNKLILLLISTGSHSECFR